ncbi:muscarinic acetylcholine receptor M3-like [Saccostrea cucullata]|uniref:muscarinic acetylcholine receptor M3-like n=1 Tax=Saccostrea cuccullata TaxID=36930 RepID=UPI002ED51980
MSTLDFSEERRLEDWNKSLTVRLIPNDIVLALYLVIGVIGNTVVLCVYIMRFRGQHGERYFVPFLALADLLACITCVTFTFYLNFHQADFKNETFCKVMWPLATGTTFMSVFLLLVITIERYFKVCRPFHEFKHKRLFLFIIVTMSVFIAAPSPFFFGRRATFIPERNLTRYRCTVIKDINSPGPNIYGFVLGMFSIFTPITIAAVYIRIGWKLRGQLRFRQQFLSTRNSPQLSKSLGRDCHGHSCETLILDRQHHGTHFKLFKEKIILHQNHSCSTEFSDHDDRRMADMKQSPDEQTEETRHFANEGIVSHKTNEASKENKCDMPGCAKTEVPGNARHFSLDSGVHLRSVAVQLSQFRQRTCSSTRKIQIPTSSLTNHTPKTCVNVETNEQIESVNKNNNPDSLTKFRSNVCEVCHLQTSENAHVICYRNAYFNSSAIWGRQLPEYPVRRHVNAHKGHLGMHRFTIMFMLITGICFLCYLPKIFLLILESVMTSFWVSIPDQYLGFVLFLYRFYIFNNVCNPIIYCLFDFRFRREIKFLCCRRRIMY